jgi:hypothetical protein
MGSWSIRGIDSELKFREYDEYISILCCPDGSDDAYNITMTYQEFEELANWLGFDAKPRDYRKSLSGLETEIENLPESELDDLG